MHSAMQMSPWPAGCPCLAARDVSPLTLSSLETPSSTVHTYTYSDGKGQRRRRRRRRRRRNQQLHIREKEKKYLPPFPLTPFTSRRQRGGGREKCVWHPIRAGSYFPHYPEAGASFPPLPHPPPTPPLSRLFNTQLLQEGGRRGRERKKSLPLPSLPSLSRSHGSSQIASTALPSPSLGGGGGGGGRGKTELPV